jgi:hypothetical protein
MLKPLDLQTIMTRAVDVQRMQQIHNTRPQIEQQQFSEELRHQFELHQSQVEQTAVAGENAKIQNHSGDDSKRQSTARRFRRFFGKKPNEPEEELQVKDVNGPGQHIDIKI